MSIRPSRSLLIASFYLSLVLSGCDHHSSPSGDGPSQELPNIGEQTNSSPNADAQPHPDAQPNPDAKPGADKLIPPVCPAGQVGDASTGLCAVPAHGCSRGFSWDAAKSHCLTPFAVELRPSEVTAVVPGDNAADVGSVVFTGLDQENLPAELIESIAAKEVGDACGLNLRVTDSNIFLNSTASRDKLTCAFKITVKTTAGRSATVNGSIKLAAAALSVKVDPTSINTLIAGNDLAYITTFAVAWNGTDTATRFSLAQASDSSCQVHSSFRSGYQLFLAFTDVAKADTVCRFTIKATTSAPLVVTAESHEFAVKVENPQLQLRLYSNDPAPVVFGLAYWPVAKVFWNGRSEQSPTFELGQNRVSNLPNCTFGFEISDGALYLNKPIGEPADCELVLKASFRDGRDVQPFAFKVKTREANLSVAFPDLQRQGDVVRTNTAWIANVPTPVAKYLVTWDGFAAEPALSLVKGSGCDGVAISLDKVTQTISAQGTLVSNDQTCSVSFVATADQKMATVQLSIPLRNTDAKALVTLNPNLELTRGAAAVDAGKVTYIFDKKNRFASVRQENLQLLQEDNPGCLKASLDIRDGYLTMAANASADNEDATCYCQIEIIDSAFLKPVLSNKIAIKVAKTKPAPEPPSPPRPHPDLPPTPNSGLDTVYISNHTWRCALDDDLSQHKIEGESVYVLFDFARRSGGSVMLDVRAKSDDHALMQPTMISLNAGTSSSSWYN